MSIIEIHGLLILFAYNRIDNGIKSNEISVIAQFVFDKALNFITTIPNTNHTALLIRLLMQKGNAILFDSNMLIILSMITREQM